MLVALITGANRGLGFEFARQYVHDGWRVFATCRDPKSASKLQQLAKDAGGKLTIVAMDVTDSESVHAAAAQLKDVAIDLVPGIIVPCRQRPEQVTHPTLEFVASASQLFVKVSTSHQLRWDHRRFRAKSRQS